jgi:hypothetical protein
MKQMPLLPLLFCLFLFACNKDLNTNGSGVKPENSAIKKVSSKSFTTDNQTQATINKFILDSIHDFNNLNRYLSQFLNNKFKYTTIRQNASMRVDDDDNSGESDEMNGNSWSTYYDEPGDLAGTEDEYSYSTGDGYTLAVFEGIAYGTANFPKRGNTIIINFPYAYRIGVNRDRKYHYLISGHPLISTLTGSALGELEYAGGYAFNVTDVQSGSFDGQMEGFVNIKEKRTRIVDDQLTVTFKAGAKAELFEVGGELENGRTVQSATNCIGDYSINIVLQLTTPYGAADQIYQWTYWGNQYLYPKPAYYMIIHGLNVGYQQN